MMVGFIAICARATDVANIVITTPATQILRLRMCIAWRYGCEWRPKRYGSVKDVTRGYPGGRLNTSDMLCMIPARSRSVRNRVICTATAEPIFTCLPTITRDSTSSPANST